MTLRGWNMVVDRGTALTSVRASGFQKGALRMASRERCHATAGFLGADRAFLLPPWTWGATAEHWIQEGLPKGVCWVKRFNTRRPRRECIQCCMNVLTSEVNKGMLP